jgi:hypothetical protein
LSAPLSVRAALEVVLVDEPEDAALYAHAVRVLEAARDEIEAREVDGTVASFNAWSDATERRRRLERGEDV